MAVVSPLPAGGAVAVLSGASPWLGAGVWTDTAGVSPVSPAPQPASSRQNAASRKIVFFSNLSQGQRQLLNIARASISKAPILILDEATSSVDTRTEKHIEHGMDRLMASRTTLVIAHRLSTVRNANAIMVLENGEIIERGDHDDLLAMRGRYYNLYTGLSELA